jgi:hypothetical protein
MNTAQLHQIRTAIDANPQLANLSDAEVAQWFSAPSIPQRREVAWFDKRTMYSQLGLERGVILMQTLRAIAASEQPHAPLIAEIVNLLEDVSTRGIDLTLDESLAYINNFHQVGLISEPERQLLASLAFETVSPHAYYELPPVRYWHVARARALNV